MEDGTFFKISLFRFRRASELPNSSSCLDPILESDSVPVFPWSLGPSAKSLAFLTYVLIAVSRFYSILQTPDVVIVSQRRHPQVWPPRQPPKTSDRAREPSSRPQSARGARRLPEKLPGGPQMAPNRQKHCFQKKLNIDMCVRACLLYCVFDMCWISTSLVYARFPPLAESPRAPRRPQNGPGRLRDGPRRPPRWSKRAPRRPKIAPRRPRWSQDGFSGLQNAPRALQEGFPGGSQDAKIDDFSMVFAGFWGSRLFGDRTLQDCPRGPQDRPRTA